MERQGVITDHPKRRRRRRADRAPISGWLIPSNDFNDEVGRIAPEFFADLFHHKTRSGDEFPVLRYAALAPWLPPSRDVLEDAAWTIVPVQPHNGTQIDSEELGPSTIYISPGSLAFQNLTAGLHGSQASIGAAKGRQKAEIRILDVQPLELDVVYVTVDRDSLQKHDEVQKKFGGGFDYTQSNGSTGRGKGKAGATSRHIDGEKGKFEVQGNNDTLIMAIRSALVLAMVVRQDDILSLPLPAHPITHVPLPPFKVSLCEPVSQGLLSDTTRVVINRVSHDKATRNGLPNSHARRSLHGMTLDEENDTTNEHFFSAAENEASEDQADSDAAKSTSDVDSSGQDSDSSSDDSLQNLITLNKSHLPSQPSGVLSSRTAGTPHGGRYRANGIHTPGSVYSNYTATTARQDSASKGKLLRARGLMASIPNELLHPKPSLDEDEEARVFVDIKTLLKLGCFSGDWVHLEAVSTSDCSSSALWNADAFGDLASQCEFRPAKVYGLPDLSLSVMPRYLKGGPICRRSSQAATSGQMSSGLAVWLSPILLANLGGPMHVRLKPLVAEISDKGVGRNSGKRAKIDPNTSPPVARELTLLRISSPLSTERALQTGIFTALKRHFEIKRRVLQQGDIIALRIDKEFSRMLSQPVSAPDVEHEAEELFSLVVDPKSSAIDNLGIAWFQVGQVSGPEAVGKPYDTSRGDWGEVACIEPTVTRMRQAGSDASKVPSASDNTWQYYLGVKPAWKVPMQLSNSVGQYVTSLPQRPIAPLRRRLRELLAAATSPRALHLGMDPVVVLLHSTQRGIGKGTIAWDAATDLGLHVFDIDAYDVMAEGGGAGDVNAEALLKARVERALSCGPSCTALLLRHVNALTADRMAIALKQVTSNVRVLIATTTEIENIPDGVRALFTHELEVSAPDEGEREEILRRSVDSRTINLAHDDDLAAIAIKSAALVAGDLVDIIERALVARQNRLEQLTSKSSPVDSDSLVRDVLVSGGENARCVIRADFDIAVEAARKNFADAIGAPKIPNVSWNDVGGLENVKDAVMETIQLPLERPELFAKGMKKRSGILFYGPPGTGKTLLAKAIATEFSLNFFSVKGPELLNMYIGESEANVRRVFQRARDARPCVVFFNELDSVAPKRGNQGDSSGVMDRIISQLLAELDGIGDGDEGAGGVFVIGATN